VIVSGFGIVFLVSLTSVCEALSYKQAVLGSLIGARNPIIVGGKKAMSETEIVQAASSCSTAAGLYVIFLLVCIWQSYLHNRIRIAQNLNLAVGGVRTGDHGTDPLSLGAPASPMSIQSATRF
jgi:hypothetical protein